MVALLSDFFFSLRPAFSRTATWHWFILVFLGFILRNDFYGVSSLVRALNLSPELYESLLHFFHSTAWSCHGIFSVWTHWIITKFSSGDESLELIGDHTYAVKDARKMPEVVTLHQNSETSSKPSFFRGHFWAFIGCRLKIGSKSVFLPIWGEIHRSKEAEPRSTRIVTAALQIAQRLSRNAVLVLDAFFSVGPVFTLALNSNGLLHIITRAKKNTVAYEAPELVKTKRPGRPKKYGRKITLAKSFDKSPKKFNRTRMSVYGKEEVVRWKIDNMIWKPVKTYLRFIWIESSRGRMVLMTSDMTMNIERAITLYCYRAKIESFFNVIKNLLGGLKYHFWTKYLEAISRQPKKNEPDNRATQNPEKTSNALAAIEKFVSIHMMVYGVMQILAALIPNKICREAHCWMRTPCGETPSPFVVRMALANYFSRFFRGVGKKPTNRFIRRILKKAA